MVRISCITITIPPPVCLVVAVGLSDGLSDFARRCGHDANVHVLRLFRVRQVIKPFQLKKYSETMLIPSDRVRFVVRICTATWRHRLVIVR